MLKLYNTIKKISPDILARGYCLADASGKMHYIVYNGMQYFDMSWVEFINERDYKNSLTPFVFFEFINNEDLTTLNKTVLFEVTQGKKQKRLYL